MKKRLCIVQCGRTKIWKRRPGLGAVAAREAYVGGLAKLSIAYAEMFFEEWVILSAKYGFLRPGDLVEDYDVSFNSKKDEVVTPDWLKKQLEEKGLTGYDEVVLLGGQKYARVVKQVFAGVSDVQEPLKGCKGIGYMLQRVKGAVDKREELEN